MVLGITACGSEHETVSESGSQQLRLAVTSSTRDSGLLAQLTPQFESTNSAKVLIIASGTGKALKLGANGDVDLVFVHAPDAENAFVAAGHAVRRETVMYNYFTLLGPPDDPAGVRTMSASEALRKVADFGAFFVSRGDDSGTHKREKILWAKTGGRPDWSGYIESGQGMGVTLVLASEKQGYVLSDMGTYLAFQDKIHLEPMLDEQESLLNTYGILEVNPAKHTNINHDLARRFVDFIISEEAQQIIANYKIGRHVLFRALRTSKDHRS